MVGNCICYAAIVACGLFLPGIQANAVGKAFTQITGEGAIVFGDVGVYKLVALVVVIGLLAILIFGGIKRIAQFAELVVPFMAIGYFLMAVIIVVVNISDLPKVLSLIFTDAFTPMGVLVLQLVGV